MDRDNVVDLNPDTDQDLAIRQCHVMTTSTYPLYTPYITKQTQEHKSFSFTSSIWLPCSLYFSSVILLHYTLLLIISHYSPCNSSRKHLSWMTSDGSVYRLSMITQRNLHENWVWRKETCWRCLTLLTKTGGRWSWMIDRVSYQQLMSRRFVTFRISTVHKTRHTQYSRLNWGFWHCLLQFKNIILNFAFYSWWRGFWQ